MRIIKTASIITLLLISSLSLLQKAEATQGQAKVYIINLSGVPGRSVDGCVVCLLGLSGR